MELKSKIKGALAICTLAFHVFSIPLFLSYFLFLCALPPLWPLIFLYLIYMCLDSSYEDGRGVSYRSLAFQRLPIWRWFCNYFPISLHKTVDLEPTWVPIDSNAITTKEQFSKTSVFSLKFLFRLCFWWYFYLLKPAISGILHSPRNHVPHMKPTGKKYIFGYHPHGIIAMGLVGGICTEGSSWSKLFPGIPMRCLTLADQFIVPLYREYILGLGMASVSKGSCRKLLANNQSICIVIGGARESLLARPGTLDLVLGKRLGFIKLAFEAGNTDIVPVLAFGENDLYHQVASKNGTLLHTLQTKMKDLLGFTLPLMNARGIFNYDVGLLPYRRPINVVIGRPIPIPYDPNPSQAILEYFHSEYVKELEHIFRTHKHKFYKDWSENGDHPVETFELNIID